MAKNSVFQMLSRQFVATSQPLCREPGTGDSALLPGESYLTTRTLFKAAVTTHIPYQTHPTTMQQHQVRNFEKGRGRSMRGIGAYMAGGCAWQGGMHRRGHTWQGARMAGDVHGGGGVWLGGGPAWQGSMCGGDMHGGGHSWQGRACAGWSYDL